MSAQSKPDRPAYATETYGFLDKALRRYGPVADRSVGEAIEGFARTRSRRRHMVFAPDPEGPEGARGALFAVSRPSFLQPEEQSVDLMWVDERGCVHSRENVDLPGSPDHGYSLKGREAELRAIAADPPPDRRRRFGAALSPYSGAIGNRAVNDATYAWQDAILAVSEPKDRETMRRGERVHVRLQAKFERKRYAASLREFTRHLDPEAMKVLRQTGISGIKRYNWLAGDGEPEVGRRRVQAAQAYPLLFGEMSEANLGPNVEFAIDQGKPLAPALAAAMQVPESTLKRLQGVHWQRAGRTAIKEPRRTLGMLNEVPVNWTPVGRKDWAAFHTVGMQARTLASDLGRETSEVIKSTGGRWQEAASAFRELHTSISGVRDMVRRVSDEVVLPAIVQRAAAAGLDVDRMAGQRAFQDLAQEVDARSAIQEGMLGGKSLSKCAQASRRWHRSLTRIDAVKGETGGDISWPALSDAFTTADGWQVVPLTSQNALSDEGAAMDHCVGGYASSCIEGRDHILSVRDAAGARVSTVEITEWPGQPHSDDLGRALDQAKVGGRTLLVAQNYGVDNDESGPPDRPVERAAAVRAYLAELEASPPDWAAIDAGRAEAQRELASQTGLVRRVGYDPQDRETQQAIYAIHAESMIGPGRKAKTPDAFLEATGLGARIDEAIAGKIEAERARNSEQAHWRANNAVREEIEAFTETDPAAAPAPAMSYAEYQALPTQARADIQVVFAWPGEGVLRDYYPTRSLDGVLHREADACREMRRTLDDALDTGSPFLERRLAGDARRHVVAFTRQEAEVYRAVAEQAMQRVEARAAVREDGPGYPEVMAGARPAWARMELNRGAERDADDGRAA